MAPIRVGIVGLQALPIKGLPVTNGTGYWASMSHLPALRALPEQYEIAAVCNTSIESAERAIKQFGLSESTRAYGDVEDLANDPDVDLVIISVNVKKHFIAAKPILENKKQVFVEWPLGSGLVESEQLAKLANDAGVRTFVGVQARADPLIRKAKSIVESGQLGQVISSSALVSTSIIPFDSWWQGAEYFVDHKSGGNTFFIYFGHFLDSFIHVLGDFTDVQAILKRNVDSVSLLDFDDKVAVSSHPKTSPDQIFVQGTLESDAVVSIAARKSRAEVDETSFRWIITGTEGELELIIPHSHWQFGEPTRSLRLKIGNNETQMVDFLSDDKIEGTVPPIITNILRQYDALAKNDEDAVASFQSALKTHRLLDRIIRAAGWESF